MTEELPYYFIPDPPDSISGVTILVRMIDGLGFRFRWATEGLRDSDFILKHDAKSKNIKELIEHIWGLINWINISLTGVSDNRTEEIHSQRKSVLEMIVELRKTLLSMNDEELQNSRINNHSFWHFINGPITDAFTHVGQINSLRRLAGNPTPKTNVFKGTPPLRNPANPKNAQDK